MSLDAATREALLAGPYNGCNPLRLLWNGKFYSINQHIPGKRWVIRFPCGAVAESGKPDWFEPHLSCRLVQQMWDRIGAASFRGWINDGYFILLTPRLATRFQLGPQGMRSFDRIDLPL